MKRLTNDLKKILAGLACQDAGEFLTMRQKYQVLGISEEVEEFIVKDIGRQVVKRIGVISNEQGEFTILDHVIDDCLQANAQLDLLAVQALSKDTRDQLESVLRHAGVKYQILDVQAATAQAIADYLKTHTSLMFMAAEKGNAYIKDLVHAVEATLEGYIPVPMVYVAGNDVFQPGYLARAM